MEDKMVAIARIRRAAAELKSEGAEITITALAEKASCTYAEMSHYVNRINGLKEEIGVVQHNDSFEEYRRAALNIRNRNNFVTPDALARELGKKTPGVRMMLSRHPEWAAALELKTYGEAAVETRRRKYIAAVVELYRTQAPITYAAIARAANVNREQVTRDLGSFFKFSEIVDGARKQLENQAMIQAAE